MKYRVGDLFKWRSDECLIPDAMGDVYVLVKDYALLKGEEDSYLKKEEDTYSLLTVCSSVGDYFPFSSEKPYEVIEDRIDQCLYRVGNVADINSYETVEFEEVYDDDYYLDLIERFEEVYDDDDYEDDDYSVEEDNDEWEEDIEVYEDEAKDIFDLIERCVKRGTTRMDVVKCEKIYCEDCPFSYDSKLNEKHVGCGNLRRKEINDIARRFLNGEER